MISGSGLIVRLVAVGVVLSALAGGWSGGAQTRVQVRGGALEGSDGAGVVAFKGIPFAAPPVGDLRWRAPQPAKAWAGVRTAKSFPVACEQALTRSHLPWTEEFMPQGTDSEDCLYLNVWTPSVKAKGLPVYVFLHGGAYREGATSIAVYDGAALAAKGAVVVTIQYRLGVFGFLAHPELTAESADHASGNYALMDCLAAMGWVKQNIAAFGGNPERVTVGGQSAGAGAVHALLASPMARGLMQGAIAESGSSVGPPLRSLAAAEQDGQAFAASRGAGSLAALRALPAEQLLPRATDPNTLRFAPIVDGKVLPEDPNAAIASGHALDVPILTGMQADEGSSTAGYGRSTQAQMGEAAGRMGSGGERFRTLYPFADDGAAAEAGKVSARDRGLASMYLWASLTAAHDRSPVYTYYWAHALPWPEHPEYASFHSSELPYVLGNLGVMQRPFTGADRALSAEAEGWWLNFLRSGNPNGAGLPRWDRFAADKPETMEIDTDAHMRPLMSADRLVFWRSVMGPAAGSRAGN